MGNAGGKEKKVRALIFDPYFDTLGGGERYCLTVAECLLNKNWQVDLWWDNQNDIKKSIDRFGLKVGSLGLVGKKMENFSFIEKLILMRKYDLVFWLSDGSIPTLVAKKNILHLQAPLVGFNSKKIADKVKNMLISKVVCNSKFTKKFIDKEYGYNSLVIYPPIDVEEFKSGKKENIILAVGRFEQTDQMQSKRQDVLIKAFKNMVDKGLKGWQLVLVGGSLGDPQKNTNLLGLKNEASGYPIKFVVDSPFKVLKNYYSKAKIFWHAAGLGIDEDTQPWKVEHFGMTPVEAMASGCVPVVLNKGGLKEIVRRDEGYRWGSVEELIDKTKLLIKSTDKIERFSKHSIQSSKKYSKSRFCKEFFDSLK